jgi:hypothetical protein
MKTSMIKTALALLVASAALFAAAKRDWKVGTLTETAHARETEPPSTNVYVNSRPNLTLNRRPSTWEGFQIEGDGMRFQVMCVVGPNHTPNVTVNGPVKFAMEKGKFYVLDEDGKEWEMTVIEKALIPQKPPAK